MGEHAWVEVVEELGEKLKADAKETVLAFARGNLTKLLPFALLLLFILLVFYTCCGCCSRGGGRGMMKAPGGRGATMRRTSFERNPRGYFKDLRS